MSSKKKSATPYHAKSKKSRKASALLSEAPVDPTHPSVETPDNAPAAIDSDRVPLSQAMKKPGKKSEGGAKPVKALKTPAEPKVKKLSGLDAAAQVLTAAKDPMNAKDLIQAMADQGLWTSPGGKTPHSTLYAAILREINEKGKDSRFKKADRGLFTTA